MPKASGSRSSGTLAKKYALETTAPVPTRRRHCIQRFAVLLPSEPARPACNPLWCDRTAEWLDDARSAFHRDHPPWFWASHACNWDLLLPPLFPFLYAERAQSGILAIPRTLFRSVPYSFEVVILLRSHHFSMDGHAELPVGSRKSTEPSISCPSSSPDTFRHLHCRYRRIDCCAYAAILENQKWLTGSCS